MENEKQRAASLFDLVVLILKHKGLILAVVFLVTASFVLYSILRGAPSSSSPGKALYTSACLIEPDGVSAEKLKAILLSREAEKRFSEALRRMPEVQEALKGVLDGPPTLQSQAAVQDWGSKQLSIQIEGSYIRLTFAGPTAKNPVQILEDYLKIISDMIRESALPGLKAKRKLLRQELKQETDIILKAKLAERILLITELEDAAERATYYGFSVIDPPSPLFSAHAPQSKGRPNNPVLVMLVLLASFLLALLLAFCVESIQRLKEQDPQRYEQIRQYLRFGTK